MRPRAVVVLLVGTQNMTQMPLSLPGRRRDFQRQKERKPARCQRRTVSGLTIVNVSRMRGAGDEQADEPELLLWPRRGHPSARTVGARRTPDLVPRRNPACRGQTPSAARSPESAPPAAVGGTLGAPYPPSARS